MTSGAFGWWITALLQGITAGLHTKHAKPGCKVPRCAAPCCPPPGATFTPLEHVFHGQRPKQVRMVFFS